MKPLYALHKDDAGKIIAAGDFDYSYKLGDWLKSLDVRAGDTIEFGEKAERPAEVDPLKIVAADAA